MDMFTVPQWVWFITFSVLWLFDTSGPLMNWIETNNHSFFDLHLLRVGDLNHSTAWTWQCKSLISNNIIIYSYSTVTVCCSYVNKILVLIFVVQYQFLKNASVQLQTNFVICYFIKLLFAVSTLAVQYDVGITQKLMTSVIWTPSLKWKRKTNPPWLYHPSRGTCREHCCRWNRWLNLVVVKLH